jgi:hypothetical protein
LRYAYGIVSEYLAEDLSKKLAQHLNILDEAENKKRKLNSPRDKMDEKKQKKDSVEESPKAKTVMKELSKPEKVNCFNLLIDIKLVASKIYQIFCYKFIWHFIFL